MQPLMTLSELKPLVFAMLLSKETDLHTEQQETLEQQSSPELVREINLLHPKVAAMDPRAKLPAVDLAIPSLKQLSRHNSTPSAAI